MIGTKVKVGWDAAAVKKGIANISKSIGGMSRSIGSSLVGVAKWGSALGIGAGVAGGFIAKNMLAITSSFEDALTVLTTLEGSAEKAGKSFEWIKEFAAKTPYELKQVLDAFIRLRAYGIDPMADGMLGTLGDTAAGMGKDVMQAVEAIADAMMGENERLKEFGIKGAVGEGKIVYNYFDKAGKERTKEVDAGNKKMIASTLQAIWNEKYAGAMEGLSKTWTGMTSNLSDAWARFSATMMNAGPFQFLKRQLARVLDITGEMERNGTFQKWADNIWKWAKEAFAKVSKLVDDTFGVIQFVGLGNFIQGIMDKAGKAFVGWLIDGMNAVAQEVDIMTDNIKGKGFGIGEEIGRGASTGLGKFLESELLIAMSGLAGSLVALFGTAVVELGKMAGGAAAGAMLERVGVPVGPNGFSTGELLKNAIKAAGEATIRRIGEGVSSKGNSITYQQAAQLIASAKRIERNFSNLVTA